MRTAFPALPNLRIDLHFKDRPPRAPSTQSFTLYPAASAFFRFACPCTDCDGEYNLTAAVAALASAGNNKSVARAHLRCQGVRLRAHDGGQPCVTELDYQLSIGEAETVA
jgi:hypothetical protein